jgi:hypothetical protein
MITRIRAANCEIQLKLDVKIRPEGDSEIDTRGQMGVPKIVIEGEKYFTPRDVSPEFLPKNGLSLTRPFECPITPDRILLLALSLSPRSRSQLLSLLCLQIHAIDHLCVSSAVPSVIFN